MKDLLRHMMPVLIRERASDQWHASKVLDLLEGEEIVVAIAIERGYEIVLPAGAEVRLQTSHPDGVRRHSARVLRRRDVPSPCLYLSWPQEVERIQRRAHIRVNVAVRVSIRFVLSPDEPSHTIVGYTADLSAGGVKLHLPRALAAEGPVEVEIELPEHGPLICKAHVVRTGRSESMRGVARHWAALQYAGISDRNRRRIVGFVQAIQQEQIRRGIEHIERSGPERATAARRRELDQTTENEP